MSKDFLSNHHVVAGIYPVADAFDSGVQTDVVSLKDYRRATWFIITGAVEDATISNIVTVQACSTAAAAATSKMTFVHRTCLSSTTVDTWGALTAAAVTGYNFTDNATVANAIYMVEVTADEVAADGGNGYQFARLAIAETANKTITAGVICILSDPRYPGDVPQTAIA